MGKNRKQVLQRQKASLEQALLKRLAFLSEKGVAAPKIEKDTLVKKHRAAVKAVNNRLKSLADVEKRFEDAAKAKAGRAAAAAGKEKDAGKPGKPEKPKKGGEGGKEKKAKPEKKAAGPGPADGAKAPAKD